MVGHDAPRALEDWQAEDDLVAKLQSEIELLQERLRTLEAECRRLETTVHVYR